MRNNFFRGSSFEIPHQTNHVLAFSASKANLEHIETNKELYSSIRKEVGQVKSQIWLVDKEETLVWTKNQSWEDFRKQVEKELNVTDFSKNNLECPYCGKRYNRESYFKKHVRTCNEDTKVQKVSE